MRHFSIVIRFHIFVAVVCLAGTAAAMEQNGSIQAFNPSVAIPGSSESKTSFLRSVPEGDAAETVLRLSMKEAMERGLRRNLGILQSEETIRSERGRRWRELSGLLPNLTTGTSANLEKDNLAARGLNLPGIPPAVGPYRYYDIRVFLTQPVFDLAAINRTRAANRNLSAAEHAYRDVRELVVTAVGNAYLRALAQEARVETAHAQIDAARTLYDNAVQMHRAGVTPGIDELRARVELQTRRQQLIEAENEFNKQKMGITRVIGLPAGREVILIDKAPYAPLVSFNLEQALETAYQSRQDYKSAAASQQGAELSLKAATARYLPSLALEANYGEIGTDPAKLIGTYTVSGVLTIPLFLGGSIQGEVLQAEADLRRKKDELADLRAQIEFEVRASLLDLKAAAEQVGVAKMRVELAELTLSQARERFTAGVSDNLEVVQAQEAVAAAHEAYISSLYAHNLAKLELARSLGSAEKDAKEYLGGR